MARQATRLRAQRPLPGARISLGCAVGTAAAVTPYLSTDTRGRTPDPPYRPTDGNATRESLHAPQASALPKLSGVALEQFRPELSLLE
jgi:hypothetical protein